MPTARLPIDAAHRAASSDAHAIGAVTGLTDALAGKAAVAHETALTGVHGILRVGSASTGIGLGSELLASSTSNAVVAIGHQAGKANTTGSGVYIGYQAGLKATTGNIVAIGAYAGQAVTIATESVCVGGSARYSTTTGGVTAIGYAAGFANTTGSIVAIGHSAGRYLSDGTSENATAQGCTYIGNASRASTAGAANETVIGYQAIGGGSNTVRFGNASVVAWLPGATNKVAIGSSTLAFKQLYMTDGTNNWKLTVDATGPVWTSI